MRPAVRFRRALSSLRLSRTRGPRRIGARETTATRRIALRNQSRLRTLRTFPSPRSARTAVPRGTRCGTGSSVSLPRGPRPRGDKDGSQSGSVAFRFETRGQTERSPPPRPQGGAGRSGPGRGITVPDAAGQTPAPRPGLKIQTRKVKGHTGDGGDYINKLQKVLQEYSDFLKYFF